MKDIGSIFPLYDSDMDLRNSEDICKSKTNVLNFSLCREAMLAVANKYNNKKKIVLIPAYTCQTVIDPFAQNEWTCYYYGIKKDLRIDCDSLARMAELVNPSLLVVHPYNGMEFNEEEMQAIERIKNSGCDVLEDITQCIFTEKRNTVFNYTTGSYRKWYKVPDGGFLETERIEDFMNPVDENADFVTKQTDAMYLRGLYFQNSNEEVKAISIRLNKTAVAGIGSHISVHKMSSFSQKLMNSVDMEKIKDRRFSNYSYLFNCLKTSKVVKPVIKTLDEITTTPLYFPVYVENRPLLQKTLALEHIYAPVLWPVSTQEVLINDEIRYIYEHILMIPIDQRYDLQDMNKIVNAIEQ